MPVIPDGYGLIAGRSRRNAQAALEAAERAGLEPSVVRAIAEGYIAPQAVIDAYAGTAPADVAYIDGSQPPVGEDGIPIVEALVPDAGWKNAAIREWAEAHDVDLGSATTKADMLAAIAATGLE